MSAKAFANVPDVVESSNSNIDVIQLKIHVWGRSAALELDMHSHSVLVISRVIYILKRPRDGRLMK